MRGENSLVPACRIRHCGVQQVKWVFFFRINTKGEVKSHFQINLKVMVPAKRRNGTVPKFYFWERKASKGDGRARQYLRTVPVTGST